MLSKINEQIFNNSIVGQIIEINNFDFNSLMNKISNTNTKDLFILNEYSNDYKFKKSQKIKVRKLQTDTIINSCEDSMTFCLPTNIIKKILEKENSEILGFNSQLNKNKNIAIKTNNTRKIFSENSLYFELKTDESSSKRFRNLDLNDLNVNFNIRLKMPDLLNITENVGESLCVQYEKNNQDIPIISCATWYDYIINEVVCECQKQRLTINLIHSTISHIGVLKQFSSSTLEFCIIFISDLYFKKKFSFSKKFELCF